MVNEGARETTDRLLLNVVEEIDDNNKNLKYIPLEDVPFIEGTSENGHLKKVSLTHNKLNEIVAISVEVPLDVSYNPITRIDVERGAFVNIIKNTNVSSLGFNDRLVSLLRECGDTIDQVVDDESSEYELETIREWEANANNLPFEVLDRIFDTERCAISLEAVKATRGDIIGFIESIASNDAIGDVSRMAELTVRREFLPIIENLSEKDPSNEGLEELKRIIQEQNIVKLGDFNIML